MQEVFRLESERRISNDWVVRRENRFFQLPARSRNYAPAKGKVLVRQWQDGRKGNISNKVREGRFLKSFDTPKFSPRDS